MQTISYLLALVTTLIGVMYVAWSVLVYIARRNNAEYLKASKANKNLLKELKARQWQYKDDRKKAIEVERWLVKNHLGFLRLWMWLIVDRWRDAFTVHRAFPHYGVHMYEGMMGSGKTISMQEQALAWKRQYPKVKVVANYDCAFADYKMTSWRDFFDIKNGEDGVIYLIDEISTMWDSNAYRDFPPELLQEIVQQRKQRKVILSSAQHFMRVLKAIREQTFYVIKCRTIAGRLVLQAVYNGYEYEKYHEATVDSKTGKRGKMSAVAKRIRVMSDEVRESYNTYEKLEAMARDGFVPRESQLRNLRNSK